MRKTYLLMFLLIFLTTDSALGWHRRWCPRSVRCACPCPCPVPEPSAPDYCLRDKYMDFPGTTTDLYFCLAYDDGCPFGGYEDLWYGSRNMSLPYPQSCYACQSGYQSVKEVYGGGHGQQISTKAAACKWLKDNYPGGTLPSNWECKLYTFLYQGSWVYAAIEPAPKSGGAKYFGIETDNTTDETPIQISPNQIKPNKSGNVLTIKYNDGGPRRALIWRK